MGTLSDLDGYSMQSDNTYQIRADSSVAPSEVDDFGFDPPSSHIFSKIDQTYSPPEAADSHQYGNWPDFGQEKDDSNYPIKPESLSNSSQPSYELDRTISQNLPNASTAIARFGQVTPPRSNSTSSSLADNKLAENVTSKAAAPERRKRNSKASTRDSDSATTSTSSGRRRKSSRRMSSPAAVNAEEDDKRKQSLEKNRLAAAKCRVNKKEKTEQLQRDSHDKAVHNAFLKDQIMRMKQEIQQMNAILLSHANCEGCKSPAEIQKHLNDLGTEFFANHMPSFNGHGFDEYGSMSMDLSHLDHDQMMDDEYFQHTMNPGPGLLNPPLPELDRAADFDVSTPMQRD